VALNKAIMNETLAQLNLQKAFLLHQIDCTASFQLPTDEQLIELGRITLEISLEKKKILQKVKNIFDEN
jgi:3-deoxy-D-arabino-heptulosonate 7-phosphate (DAHP) synthase class II